MDTKRFNNPHYKRQIHAQRTYKREVHSHASSDFFAKLKWIVPTVVLVAALVYLAYFAKFLNVTNVQVSGADAILEPQIQSQVQSYLSQHPYGLPQRNVLFFMPSRLSKFLAAGDLQISSVGSVQRKLWHTVSVSVVQRVPAYTLQVGGAYYTVYSDGTLGSQVDQSQNLAIVDGASTDAAIQGSHLFTAQQTAFVGYVRDNFSKALPLQISHFEISSEASSSLTVVAQSGARFLLDDTTDPAVAVSRLETLWNQLTPSQQANLAYFDLRFDPKAYGCYKADPCAATVLAPTPTPTPTVTPTPPPGV